MKMQHKMQFALTLLVVAASVAVAVPFTDNGQTYALWHMDEIVPSGATRFAVADDVSVSGRTAANLILGKNTPNDPLNYPTVAPGFYGNALSFASTNLQTAFSDDAWTGHDSAKIQFMVNQNAGVSVIQTAVHASGSWEIRMGNGTLTAYIWLAAGGTTNLTRTYTQGEWTDVELLISGTEMTLIVDGSSISKTITGMINTQGRVQVGSSATATRGFDGMIDELRIAAIPEPATMALMGLGYLGLRLRRRTDKKQNV